MNEAIILFPSDPNATALSEPYAVKLPDGYDTWTAAWERDSTVFWVSQKGLLHRYDFSNPTEVKESRIEPADVNNFPEPLRAALIAAIDGAASAD